MKALSIKQPWAWLICNGFKDVENRDWFIGRRVASGAVDFSLKLPTRIYVHAGKQTDLTEETLSFIRHATEIQGVKLRGQEELTWGDVLTFGAVIGEVDIIACVIESTSPWFVGKYGFVLKNPVLYTHPMPCRGQLGFFNLPEGTLCVAREGVEK